MNNSIVVGGDIGGSHISTALVDLKRNQLLPETFERQSIGVNDSSEDILRTWAACILRSCERGRMEVGKVGMAIPGPFDYERGVSFIKDQQKYESLYGLAVKDLLADRLEMEPQKVRFINDAEAFLQGEMAAGAGLAFQRAVGLTLGTGLGSAWYMEGQAQDANLWCALFQGERAEDYLAGRWLKETYRSRCGEVITSVQALCERALQDRIAQEVLLEYGVNLAEFILEYLLERNPEVLILGGNIAKASSFFLGETDRILKGRHVDLPIRLATLGEQAAIYGAAKIWR